MTRNKKLKVLNFVGWLAPNDYKDLKHNTIDYNHLEYYLGEKMYYNSWGGTNRHRKLVTGIEASLASNEILEVKEKGNDAPRGGVTGDYIIFKNNKANKETIEFIKVVLETIF